MCTPGSNKPKDVTLALTGIYEWPFLSASPGKSVDRHTYISEALSGRVILI